MIPADDTFLDVACDVAIRFKGHDSYGNEAGAIRAFARRAPGFERSAYEQAFRVLVSLYDRAVDALQRHRVPDTGGRFAKHGDIDFESCMTEMDQLAPDVGRREKACILEWVIYWHYLR